MNIIRRKMNILRRKLIIYHRSYQFCSASVLPSTALLSADALNKISPKLVITDAAKSKFGLISKPNYALGFIGPSRVGKSTISNGLGLYLASVNNQTPFSFIAADSDNPVTVGINSGFIMKNDKIQNPNAPNANFILLDSAGVDRRTVTSEATSRFLMTFCSALCVVSRDGTKYLNDLQKILFAGISIEELEKNDEISFCDTLIYIMNRPSTHLRVSKFHEAFNDPELKSLSKQFPNRQLITIKSFDIEAGTGKSWEELDQMDDASRNAIQQPFVEGEVKKLFEQSGWNKIETSLKAVSMSNNYLSGKEILNLMETVCDYFNDKHYVGINETTQKKLFTDIGNDYQDICYSAYENAMKSLEIDPYKIHHGQLQYYHLKNKAAAKDELNACLSKDLFSIKNNETLEFVRQNIKLELNDRIENQFQEITTKNTNKKILPPKALTNQKKITELADKNYIVESVDTNGKFVAAIKYLCCNFIPRLGHDDGITYWGVREGVHDDFEDDIPLKVMTFSQDLNKSNIFDCKIPTDNFSWRHYYSTSGFGQDQYGVEYSNLKLEGCISDIGKESGGIYEGEKISQNQSATSTFNVSTTSGKQLSFSFGADVGGDDVKGKASEGISLTESKTQSLTQSYSYGYSVSGVEYITFDAKADLTLSIDRESPVVSDSVKGSSLGVGAAIEAANIRSDTKSKTVKATLKLKIPSSHCEFVES